MNPKNIELTGHSRRIRALATLLVLGVVLFGHSTAVAQSADEIADRLREKYESIDALQATFTQTMTSEFLDEPESASGKVILSGDRLRIETDRQTFVTDGSATWLYDSDANEVLVNDYIEEEMFPVRELLFDYEKNYEVESVEAGTVRGSAVQIVHLRARDEATPYREVAISARDSDGIVTRVDILDVNQTRMVFELEDIVLNPKLSADTFIFEPPSTAEVIDLRTQGG
jgi:outer membrane lipoprotein-sorting protein